MDTLTITVVGAKIGRWPVDFLATPDHELVERLAVFTDTDARPGPAPPAPAWMERPPVLRSFRCQPTLEPALVPGNEVSVGEALDAMGVPRPNPIEPTTIDNLFQNAARKRKGEFSLELAAVFAERLAAGQDVAVPDLVKQMLDYLFEPSPDELMAAPAVADDDDATTAD